MSAGPSKKTRRQARILEALELNPAMRVNELASDLDVSSETVRRDLAELDATGRIKRTYGGAVRTAGFEPALTERLKLHIAARERIARHAVGLLDDAHSIFVGGGATTLHFARALRSVDRHITVLTASFSIAMELSSNPLIEVMALPGIVEPKEGLACGSETLGFIAQYRTPIALIGASAIDEEGSSEALLKAAQVYKAMIRSADRTLILADKSKFGRRSLQLVTGWGPRTGLVTDRAPGARLLAAIGDAGSPLHVAE